MIILKYKKVLLLDFLNIIDLISLIYFTYEKINPDNSLQIFKITYIIRILRILRYLEYMYVILFIFRKNFSSFLYTLFILFWMIFIYSMIGMKIYGNKIDSSSFENQQFDFNSFLSSFMSVFNIITLGSWYKMFLLGTQNANQIVFNNKFFYIYNFNLKYIF